MAIELRARHARALIEPRFGGRLHQLLIEVDGQEVPLLASPEDVEAYRAQPLFGGCYPMAPWPNRIRDGRFTWAGRDCRVPLDAEGQALHGTVFDQPWEVVARVGRVVEMTCALGPQWPWDGRAWQRIELGDGWLSLRIEVRSAREAFPAGGGWHPWFRREVAGSLDASVVLPAGRRYILEGHLPTGETERVTGDHLLDGRPLGGRSLDDCYRDIEPQHAHIDWDCLRLEMTFDRPGAHVQVFTPPGALCIEPQTCAPDAFNFAAAPPLDGGVATVSPGRPLTFASRWTWYLRNG